MRRSPHLRIVMPRGPRDPAAFRFALRAEAVASGAGRTGCRAVWIALATLPLSACLGVEGRVPVGYAPPPAPVVAEAAAPARAAPGAIYAPGRFMGLAEDNRARRIGDILTIRLVETTEARKTASASASRATDLSLRLPQARPFNDLPVGLFTGGTENSFEGGGRATQSNQLRGEITVAVVDVLPNGVLSVRGQKVVRLNRGDEFVNISGLVRPEDVGPDNRVPSTRVADARIAYSGVGEIAAQSRQGWVQRLLNFFTPF